VIAHGVNGLKHQFGDVIVARDKFGHAVVFRFLVGFNDAPRCSLF
jgi:hypothetical protein